MSEPQPSPPPSPPEPGWRWGFQPGRLVLGLVLAGLGLLWLLEAFEAVDVDWEVALPVALIGVGAAVLVAGATGRSSRGLITIGVVLTVVLLFGTVVDIPFTGGVGDRTERLPVFGDRSYDLAIGKLTVDLSGLSWSEGDPLEATIEAHVGIGQLVVVLPARPQVPCVVVNAEAGIGQVSVFGEERSGIGPDYLTGDVCLAPPVPRLELSVGLGQVEVTRA